MAKFKFNIGDIVRLVDSAPNYMSYARDKDLEVVKRHAYGGTTVRIYNARGWYSEYTISDDFLELVKVNPDKEKLQKPKESIFDSLYT